MKYVEAIEDWTPEPRERSLFLAGGITGCPDWQQDLVGMIAHIDDLTVVNPRRANFPMGDPKAGEIQIRWEHAMLRRVSRVIFWFPKETLCPITLYELGSLTRSGRILTIGVEPGYQRDLDVRIQTELAAPRIPIVSSIEEIADKIEGMR